MELTLKQKTAFGIGAVGKDMVYALSASYVMYYYQDVLGLSASFVGLLLMAARFFDAFNDPFMGVLVAKTRTRWGRFRPWIFSGTLLNALVLYALFAAVQFEYLFGGAEAAAMEGGWAEYARSGFMQLVIVAAVNLAALLFCAVRAGHSRPVRALCLLLAALTLCGCSAAAAVRLRHERAPRNDALGHGLHTLLPCPRLCEGAAPVLPLLAVFRGLGPRRMDNLQPMRRGRAGCRL